MALSKYFRKKEPNTKRYRKLTLLHSNDLHGDFLAEKIDERLVGGVSQLSGYINKVRAEEPNTLYAIAGDMFRGSIIDSEYQGISTIEIMNMLSPDVVTLGNHETDYGISHLLFLEKCAKFPIINANFHIRTNHARLFEPYKIFEIDGMKILFIGIITEEVLAQTKNDGLVGTFVDLEDAVTEIGHICNAYNATDIDFTVLLTHIGFEEDKKLAAALDPAWGIDVIIGGHSHTLLDKPAKVNDILIVQAGTGTDQIGRFDIIIDTQENCVTRAMWRCIPINDKTCGKDSLIERLIGTYKSRTDEKYNHVVTRFKRLLTHPDRYRETELGGLLADALRESLGLDIMLMGSGSIRVEDMGPIVMLKDLIECFPYNDSIHMLTVTGAQLKRMILYVLRDEAFQGEHTEFYQYSEGLHVEYDQATHSFLTFDFGDAPVQDDDLFQIGLQLYHFNNLEECFGITREEIEANGPIRTVATSCQDVIEEYLSTHTNLDREAGDRLVLHLL